MINRYLFNQQLDSKSQNLYWQWRRMGGGGGGRWFRGSSRKGQRCSSKSQQPRHEGM